MRVFGILIAVLAALLTTRPLQAQEPDSPVPVIRALMLAIYGNDVAAYERLTLPDPQRARLTAGARRNDAAWRELQDDPEGLQLRQLRPFLLGGKEVSAGRGDRYPDGTTAMYMVAHRGGPMLMRLQRQPDGWRADVRWWAAQLLQQSGTPARNSPEFAVRALLTAMFRLDRRGAAQWLSDPRGLEMLFADAPTQREPSGVYEATVREMPLVQIGPGEFYDLPTGARVEGADAPDRRLLVGWFGPTEVPFVVRKINGQWRVSAEPYFAMLQ